MRVAINTIYSSNENPVGDTRFVQQLVEQLIQGHPEHEFILLQNREQQDTRTNVTRVPVAYKDKNPIRLKFWYDFQLPAALRSFSPDVLIQPYGICSLGTKIPQVLIVQDLLFRDHPQWVEQPYRWLYKRFTAKFLKKAAKVLAASGSLEQKIGDIYLGVEKMTVIPAGCSPLFKPVTDEEERQEIKDIYADGREYFLFTGGLHPVNNPMTVLKAFSVFKKWQQSNMKLVMVNQPATINTITEKLSTYKYRDDVILLDSLKEKELALVTAASYASIQYSFFENRLLPVIEAMRSEVPVIASDTAGIRETGGDAILYGNANDHEALANHMILLYKDEQLRKRLIVKGAERASAFNWEGSAALLWNSIEEAAAGNR